MIFQDVTLKKQILIKKITAKTGDLHRYQLQLIKEQENDQKKKNCCTEET